MKTDQYFKEFCVFDAVRRDELCEIRRKYLDRTVDKWATANRKISSIFYKVVALVTSKNPSD